MDFFIYKYIIMKDLYTLILLFIGLNITAQNTVGIIKNDAGAYNGYTLFAPNNSTETYLINNCGQVVHQWTSTRNPGASAYLLENGNLLRTGGIKNDQIQFGGVGGAIELYDWDGNLLWEYIYSSTEVSQHHDIYPLPNGNILMLAVSTMTESEAIQAGRDPLKIGQGKLFNEQILELEPVNTNEANIVWEWNIKDHLIQDFDATKDNFGIVKDHPELLNINYLNGTNVNANWLHINSIQYNSTLDQIIMSSRLLSEVYIIDHSTSTELAASNTGGTYGKGGDLLYRWGNPEAYDHGTSNDRILFGQHYPHWIAEGLTDAGKIIIYNNGGARAYSSIEIISPPSSPSGFYNYEIGNSYLPTIPEWSYTDPNDPLNFYSPYLSGAQRLPNGNTLICSGVSGYFFEIDANNNKVWEYINPDTASGILSQGDAPIAPLVFRAHKFSVDYAAFQGKDMTPGNPIELNFDLSGCNILSIDENHISNEFEIYPNPATSIINIKTQLKVDKIEVYDIYGKLILTNLNTKDINIENLSSGIYIAKIYSDNRIGSKKIMKQ
jgi:hypothetical protein